MKKILIVDDDADLRSELVAILKRAGYHTEEAGSGEEAVEKAAAGDFDVVLLDMIMPRGGGIETLSHLKKISPRTGVIMLTAFATIENAVEAVKLGVHEYLPKPCKIDQLLTAVRRVIAEAGFETSGSQKDLDGILGSLSNPTRTMIMRMIGKKKKMRLIEISKELDIEDHTKVLFHLRMLKQAGLVEQDREKLYCLTGEGERTLGCLKILETHIQPSNRQ